MFVCIYFMCFVFFFIRFFVLTLTLIIYVLFSISLQKIVYFMLLSLLSITKKVPSIRRMAERKNLYLTRLLPTPINFIGTGKNSGYHFAFFFFYFISCDFVISFAFFCPYFLIYISLFCSNCFFFLFPFLFLHFTLNSIKPW
jgi:hypothetical protein